MKSIRSRAIAKSLGRQYGIPKPIRKIEAKYIKAFGFTNIGKFAVGQYFGGK